MFTIGLALGDSARRTWQSGRAGRALAIGTWRREESHEQRPIESKYIHVFLCSRHL